MCAIRSADLRTFVDATPRVRTGSSFSATSENSRSRADGYLRARPIARFSWADDLAEFGSSCEACSRERQAAHNRGLRSTPSVIRRAFNFSTGFDAVGNKLDEWRTPKKNERMASHSLPTSDCRKLDGFHAFPIPHTITHNRATTGANALDGDNFRVPDAHVSRRRSYFALLPV